MYNTEDRKRYNAHRAWVCTALGLDKNQYNRFRFMGNQLWDYYVDLCNGCDPTGTLEDDIKAWEAKIEQTAKDFGLCVYFQTDPREASLYLDKKKIDRGEYTNAYCIY